MRVGITPRFESSVFDDPWIVFEKHLIDFFIGNSCVVTLVDTHQSVNLEDLDLIVFSGGATPGENPLRDEKESDLYRKALGHRKFILGICRGAQLIATEEGGRLEKITGHVNVTRELDWQQKSIGKCFHHWSIRDLDPSWEVVARDSKDGSIEVFRNFSKLTLGILSHPERLDDNKFTFHHIMRLLTA